MIAKGGKKTIKLTNGKGKWSIKNKGIVKVQKKSGKYITIKPIKAGRTVVACKTKEKTLKCKVPVINNKIWKSKNDRFPPIHNPYDENSDNQIQSTIIVGTFLPINIALPKGVTVSSVKCNEKKVKTRYTTKMHNDGTSTLGLDVLAIKPGKTTVTVNYVSEGKREYQKIDFSLIYGFRGTANVKKTESNYRKWRRRVISSIASNNISTWEMINAIGCLISTGKYSTKGGTTGMQLWYGGNGTCASGAKMMNDFMKDIGVSSKVHFAGNDKTSIDIYGYHIPYIRQHKNTWIKLGGERYELNCQPEQPWPIGIVKR